MNAGSCKASLQLGLGCNRLKRQRLWRRKCHSNDRGGRGSIHAAGVKIKGIDSAKHEGVQRRHEEDVAVMVVAKRSLRDEDGPEKLVVGRSLL